MLADLHGPLAPPLARDMERCFRAGPAFHQSFLASTATLLAWQLKLTFRNAGFIYGRAFMIVLMGLINAMVFWQFDVTDIKVVMGIVLQAILFLALGLASQLPTFLAARQVFYKQRGAHFYRTPSYVLACSLSQLPLAVAEKFVFGSLVYWLCGFVSAAAPFVLFELLLLVTNMAFTACFFALAAASPDLHVAEPVSMIAILFFTVFAGFVVPAGEIPSYFLWVYWINPMAWCLRALVVNEYRQDRYDVDVFRGGDYQAAYGKQMGAYTMGLFIPKPSGYPTSDTPAPPRCFQLPQESPSGRPLPTRQGRPSTLKHGNRSWRMGIAAVMEAGGSGLQR